MMTNIDNAVIELNDDEFFVLLSLIHQIKQNVEENISEDESEVIHSHVDFELNKNYLSYNTFRELVCKVYAVNIDRIVQRQEVQHD